MKIKESKQRNWKSIGMGAIMVMVLTGCASTVGTVTTSTVNGKLMFVGTRMNADIINQKQCNGQVRNDMGCAYSQLLTPLSVIDFIPSAAMDVVFLPFTIIYDGIHWMHEKKDKVEVNQAGSIENKN